MKFKINNGIKLNYEKAYKKEILESKSYWLSPSEVYGNFKTQKLLEKLFLEEIKKRKGKVKVLDVGCSYGTDIFMLNMSVDRSRVEFHGVDISQTAVRIANKLARMRGDINCKFFVRDANRLEMNEKYDIIISSETIEHLKSPLKALINMKNILKDDGAIIKTTPNQLIKLRVK